MLSTNRLTVLLLFATFVGVVLTPRIQAAVTYELGSETALLDAAFYAGQAEDGSNVAGRMAYMASLSNDGETVAFFAINMDTQDLAFFLVDLGKPWSWRRLTEDVAIQGVAPIRWTSDDASLIVAYLRIPVATGELVEYRPFDLATHEPSITRLPENNWLATTYRRSGLVDIALLPILPNGDPDTSREPVIVTDWGVAGDWPSLAPDGSYLVFDDYSQSGDPGIYDTSDVYVLQNLQDIIAAPKDPVTLVSSLAPTSLSDPDVVAIRTTETTNTATTGDFSADGSLVFYCEDWSGLFHYTWFLDSLTVTDFDVMISQADGTGEDIRLARPGNQMFMMPTPGGTRILYTRDVDGHPHIFATTLVVNTDIAGEVVGDEEDNDIVTTEEQEVSDASGTQISVPAATVVDFPAGVPQAFTINTPIDPVTQPQLPFGVEAIPVVREFGPAGTVFSAPVTVTITYTDAEVAGFNEWDLRVFLYNDETGEYDQEVTSITDRDLDNNTISFTVDHFSRFGLGGASSPMPLNIGFAGAVLLALSGVFCLLRSEARGSRVRK